MSARRAALAAALLAAGCASGSWQRRADALRQSMDELVWSGRRHKDDFVRQFGAPDSCRPLLGGESCEWEKSLGFVRDEGAEPADGGAARAAPERRVVERMSAQFDGSGAYVKGTASVRAGGRDYEGREKAVEGQGGGCRADEAYMPQYGGCYPMTLPPSRR